MVNNKYDFIEKILEDHRLNPNQRERIIHLASSEIKQDFSLEMRISKIENILNKYIATDAKNISDSKVNDNNTLKASSYTDPYLLYKFLYEYNQNYILRSTCHDIDSEELKAINDYCKCEVYNYDSHLKMIIQEYEEHVEKFRVPKNVKALIKGYLTGKDGEGKQLKRGWSHDGIEINWSSPALAQWTHDFPSIPPNSNSSFFRRNIGINSFKIEPQIVSVITSRPIQNFTQLVLHFKNLFHLKSGDQSLRAIIQRINAEKWKMKVNFIIDGNDFPDNIEHFTDVDKLRQIYNEIIQLVIKCQSGQDLPRVKISFEEKKDALRLRIHHLNQKYGKSLQSLIDKPYGQDYTLLINKKINGLCNLHLNADFGQNEFANVNLWNGDRMKAEKLAEFTGVEHVIEFPKKSGL